MDEQAENNAAGVTDPGYNHTDDWLDAKLREEAPYIDDAGFSAQVMRQVPARRRQLRAMRTAILLGVTFLACAIAYLVSGRGAFLANTAEFLVAMPIATVCAIAGGAALLVTVLGASAAALKTREQR